MLQTTLCKVSTSVNLVELDHTGYDSFVHISFDIEWNT